MKGLIHEVPCSTLYTKADQVGSRVLNNGATKKQMSYDLPTVPSYSMSNT